MMILVKLIKIEENGLFVHFYIYVLIYPFNKYAVST